MNLMWLRGVLFQVLVCFVAAGVLVFGCFGIFYLISKRSKSRLGIDPLDDELLRPAGESCRERLVEIVDHQNECLVLLMVYGIGFGFAPLFDLTVGNKVAIMGMLGGAAIWQVFRLNRSMKDRRNFELGYQGERYVGQFLNALVADGYEVFHDVPCERKGRKFNIDHVVLGESGVYCIETKTRRKLKEIEGKAKAQVTYDGEQLVFPTFSDRYGLAQTLRNGEYLSRLLSDATGDEVRAKPVLVLPGWFVKRLRREPVAVVNPKQFKAYLSGQVGFMDEAAVQRVRHQLRQLCRVSLM